MRHHFQIQHLGLSIDDPQDLVATQAEALLGMFRRAAQLHEPAPGRLRLQVHDDGNRPEQLEQVPQVWSGTHDGVALAVSRRGSRRRIELPGRAVLDFDLDRLWASLAVRDDRHGAARSLLLLRLVCDALTRGGHSFLHAACLAAPRGDGWQGVVVSAPSHTGKTTTALALARSGWRLLGDDVTYVRPPHLGSRVWAFPRAVHVRPGARKLLSWLENFPLGPANGEGVHPLALGALGPRAWLDAPWLQPGLVVVLAPPNRRATRVEPIDRATALSHLGSESISAAPGVCDEDGARDFVTLGRLVCSAPACRLSVGPDPADAAERLTTFWDALGVDDRTDVRRGRRAA